MKPVIQIRNWKITGHPVPASMNYTGDKLLWYTLEGTVETDDKIAKELGMEADEVLRLQQITGLSGLFEDSEFTEAWEAESFSDIDGAVDAGVELISED